MAVLPFVDGVQYCGVDDFAATVFRTPYLPQKSIDTFLAPFWSGVPELRLIQKGARVVEKFLTVPAVNYVYPFNIRPFVVALSKATNGDVSKAFMVLVVIHRAMTNRDSRSFATDLLDIIPGGVKYLMDEIDELEEFISEEDGALWSQMWSKVKALDSKFHSTLKCTTKYGDALEYADVWRSRYQHRDFPESGTVKTSAGSTKATELSIRAKLVRVFGTKPQLSDLRKLALALKLVRKNMVPLLHYGHGAKRHSTDHWLFKTIVRHANPIEVDVALGVRLPTIPLGETVEDWLESLPLSQIKSMLRLLGGVSKRKLAAATPSEVMKMCQDINPTQWIDTAHICAIRKKIKKHRKRAKKQNGIKAVKKWEGSFGALPIYLMNRYRNPAFFILSNSSLRFLRSSS